MWRREARLIYWLEGGSRTQKPNHKPGLKEKLFLKFQPCLFFHGAKDASLGIRTDTINLDCELGKNTGLIDGLGILGGSTFPACEFAGGFGDSGPGIHHLELLERSQIQSLQLDGEIFMRVSEEDLAITPLFRSAQVTIRAADVGTREPLFCRMPEVQYGKQFLIPHPSIRILTSQMSALSHSRQSINIDQLQDEERYGFLREAEIIKGIPIDRMELLSVFRHVPITMVSRMHLLDDQKTISYTISRESKPRQTRVYDMAAIRDCVSKEVYLIPHRTQFRSVTLN
jgi:hypothetical protein